VGRRVLDETVIGMAREVLERVRVRVQVADGLVG
jgi:hypothetical protein